MLLWVWIGCAVFVLGCAWRAYRYASAPEHLRWDLYPVAHEPSPHGGSYLEEKDWWTKPREVDRLNEYKEMFLEIVFLKGVWKHNPRLWVFSFPFHFGLYLIIKPRLVRRRRPTSPATSYKKTSPSTGRPSLGGQGIIAQCVEQA